MSTGSQDNSTTKQNTLPPDVEPKSELWSKYEDYRKVADKEWTNEWKGSMEGAVIFAGLFSAVISAFLNESMNDMKPDPAEQAVNALQTISLQLKVLSDAVVNASSVGPVRTFVNASIPNAYIATNPLDHTSLIVNTFWMLSLVISIICALCALLVQSWTRGYLAKMSKVLDPILRSKTRLFLQKARRKYHADGVVYGINALLHAAVFLFLVGLVMACWQAETKLGNAVLGVLIVFGFFYTVASFAFLFVSDWPFDTAVSIVFKAIIGKTCKVDTTAIIPNYTIAALRKPQKDPIKASQFMVLDDHIEIADSVMQKGTEVHALFYQRLIKEGGLEIEYIALTLSQVYQSLKLDPEPRHDSEGRLELNQYQGKWLVIYLETLGSFADTFTLEQLREVSEAVLPSIFQPAGVWQAVASACAFYICAKDNAVKTQAMKACLRIALIQRSLNPSIGRHSVNDKTLKSRVSLLASNFRPTTQFSLPHPSSGDSTHTEGKAEETRTDPTLLYDVKAGETSMSPAERQPDAVESPQPQVPEITADISPALTSTTAVPTPPIALYPEMSTERTQNQPENESSSIPSISPYELLLSACSQQGALPVLQILEEAFRTFLELRSEEESQDAVAATIANILALPVHKRWVLGRTPEEVQDHKYLVETIKNVLDAVLQILPFITKDSAKEIITRALAKPFVLHALREKIKEIKETWQTLNQGRGIDPPASRDPDASALFSSTENVNPTAGSSAYTPPIDDSGHEAMPLTSFTTETPITGVDAV